MQVWVTMACLHERVDATLTAARRPCLLAPQPSQRPAFPACWGFPAAPLAALAATATAAWVSCGTRSGGAGAAVLPLLFFASQSRGAPSPSVLRRKLRPVVVAASPWAGRRPSLRAAAAQPVEEAESEQEDQEPFTGDGAPFAGRRLRVWFLNEEDDHFDYEYGTVVEVYGEEGPEQEVTIEWDSEGFERLRLSELGRAEWLGDDQAADVVANLKEYRQESLEGAEEAGAGTVAMSVEQLRREVEAFRWMREELAARAAEAENLRRVNEELKEQREEFRERYGHLLEEEEAEAEAPSLEAS